MNEQTSPPVRGSIGRPAVVFFAKAPRPGLVKTRLCPPLTHGEAAGLYAAFLRQLLVPHPGAATYLYGTPVDGLDELRALAAADLLVRPQVGDDLFARLGACVDELAADGHARIVIRNTDSPDLPRARLDEAVSTCAPGRVVLGPDVGGGYYLIGLAEPVPELFQLGTVAPGEVFARTAARAVALGLEVVRLPVERDVDTYDDLLALWAARAARPTGT